MTLILTKLFVCVFAGFALGIWRKIVPGPFVMVVMDLFMPALVFDALVSTDIPLEAFGWSAAASAAVIFIMLAMCLAARPLVGMPLRAFSLPVLFMNAGFLGIPLIQMLFGNEGMGRIVVFDQVQSLFMFTLGIWIAAPRVAGGNSGVVSGLAAFMREPLVPVILAAAGFRIAGVTISESILGPVRFIGSATPPLALFALGLRLAHTPFAILASRETLRALGGILALRFGGGLVAGYLTVTVLHLDGLTRQVVLVASVLPSAVFSYVLAERCEAEPDLAATAVFASTVLAIPILPLVIPLTN